MATVCLHLKIRSMEGETSKKGNTGNGKELLKAQEEEERWAREKELKIQGARRKSVRSGSWEENSG